MESGGLIGLEAKALRRRTKYLYRIGLLRIWHKVTAHVPTSNYILSSYYYYAPLWLQSHPLLLCTKHCPRPNPLSVGLTNNPCNDVRPRNCSTNQLLPNPTTSILAVFDQSPPNPPPNSSAMTEKVKEVAIGETNRIKTLTSDAAKSGAYLYPIRVFPIALPLPTHC